MKWSSEIMIIRTALISRRIFWSSIGLFFLAGVLSVFAESFDLKWIKTIVPFVGGISLILLMISWTTPLVLILLGCPWLSHGWFKGINSLIPYKPWDQMSFSGKFSVYISSVAGFITAILCILTIFLLNWRRIFLAIDFHHLRSENWSKSYQSHPISRLLTCQYPHFSAGTSQTAYGFTGEQYSAETQMLYLRARYYNVNDGKFLTALGIVNGP